MNPMSIVSLDLTVWSLTDNGDEVPVVAALRYDLSDPYAVHATFTTGSRGPVPWVFARELLTDGVVGAAGLGDVRVWRSTAPGGPDVYIGLVTADGQALLLVPTEALATFLDRTYELCPPGDESAYLDTDLVIENLLAS